MEKHLRWRRMDPAEPPLVVLNATAILTGTPALPATPWGNGFHLFSYLGALGGAPGARRLAV